MPYSDFAQQNHFNYYVITPPPFSSLPSGAILLRFVPVATAESSAHKTRPAPAKLALRYSGSNLLDIKELWSQTTQGGAQRPAQHKILHEACGGDKLRTNRASRKVSISYGQNRVTSCFVKSCSDMFWSRNIKESASTCNLLTKDLNHTPVRQERTCCL